MKTFGLLLDDPDLERVAAPVGVPCARCDEPIGVGDSGFTLPYFGAPGAPKELPFHFECHMRAIVGSVAHQQGRCSCFVPGSTEDDDPALTPRQAAAQAVHYFNDQREARASIHRPTLQ